jgi:hypothetical protein
VANVRAATGLKADNNSAARDADYQKIVKGDNGADIFYLSQGNGANAANIMDIDSTDQIFINAVRIQGTFAYKDSYTTSAGVVFDRYSDGRVSVYYDSAHQSARIVATSNPNAVAVGVDSFLSGDAGIILSGTPSAPPKKMAAVISMADILAPSGDSDIMFHASDLQAGLESAAIFTSVDASASFTLKFDADFIHGSIV